MMVQLPSFLRPTPAAAPVAGAWPGATVTPAAAPAAPFTIDLFSRTPAAAPAQLPMAAFRAPTLDDLEAVGGGHFLDVSADEEEPTGGSAARTLREGAHGPEVERLQTLLAARGFNPGGVDGDFGPATERALRAFQRSQGLEVDGQFGPATRARLTGQGGVPAPHTASPAAAAPVAENGGARSRLMRGVNNQFKNRPRKCFKYAWRMVSQAGLRGIGAASQSRAGRNLDTSHVGELVRRGQIGVGDVIYVNRRPGADPSSTNMRYGPHWFVYVGNGQFADQYGIRGAQAMADFVPGRKIDTIYRTA